MYGRGTYPVITLAGWHGGIDMSATPDDLKAFDDELCRANDGAPLGIIAGIDRANVLRIRCPGPARWTGSEVVVDPSFFGVSPSFPTYPSETRVCRSVT